MMEKKILVVDDEVSILDMIKEVFESEGYTVLTAGSAEDALKIIQNESAWVMFLDIRLPGMSGVELCKKIRSKDQISIIHAFTGYSNIYGLLECRAAGFDDFFVKPVKLDVLLKAAQDSFERLERWKISDFGLT
ncbi:MAG: response regulator [Deltaproteobacteria bacterium HGW-Deltaproteobacteria-7]|nr:MAG: response regulator [Deltaproteobacteria bacterium HGW-Deltaproteobacteria-7]PKN18046.1 MAG: response regulator [Deltaproteobacteria bacterium HGW-Deltaproteobacteria-6]